MFIIPFKEFSSFEIDITLDGTPYNIKFNWNTRGEFWTMDWKDRGENVLISGIKLVLEYELIGNYPDRGLPAGNLYVVDTTGDRSPVGRDDFLNNRALQLVYVTEEEVEQQTV